MTRRSLAVLVYVGLGCGAEAPETAPWSVPETLATEIPSPEHNPLTEAGVALGRRLFFDVRLSGTKDIACATCHDPALAFSDGLAASVGASGVPLVRHTPTLVNVAWASGWFWDGGAKNLESQVFAPLFSADEMGADPSTVLDELARDASYPAEFAAAFTDGLTLGNLARAIAQYERTLVFADSPYDRALRGDPEAGLSEDAHRGLAVFERHCASCHVPGFFTDHGYHNTGLSDAFPEDGERIAWGRARITHDDADLGKFKTPTLRNVAVTAPYMHDGRFATLAEVVDHYRFGVRPSRTLAPALVGPDGTLGLPLSDDDAAVVVAFLETLTDTSLAAVAPNSG
jgi:cytochrome c peroxidase